MYLLYPTRQIPFTAELSLEVLSGVTCPQSHGQISPDSPWEGGSPAFILPLWY